MNLDELRNMSQQGQNDMERRILQLCDPQKIAQEIKDELMAEAKKAAQTGKRKSTIVYTLFERKVSRISGSYNNTDERSGPLAECGDGIDNWRQLSNVLFSMVQRYVQDDNIRLELEESDIGGLAELKRGGMWLWAMIIRATVSW